MRVVRQIDRMRNMLKSGHVLTAVAGLALGMVGCDRGWRMYQQVELGQVVPQQSLLRPHHDESGTAGCATNVQAAGALSWRDSGFWPVPLSIGMHAVAVQTDAEGRAIVKSYSAQVWSSYVLLTSAAMRGTVELQLPSRIPLYPAERAEDDGALAGIKSCRTLRGYLTNAVREIDLTPSWQGKPLPPLLVVAAGANFTVLMSVTGGFSHLMRSIQHLPLEGIEQDGYDRTFRPVAGGSIRVRNLGQRRFRVDLNLFRLYDPLALAAWVYR